MAEDRVWIWTYSGRKFHPLDPRIEDFYLPDLAHGHAAEPRFGGQTLVEYSVGEHSIRVSQEIEDRLLARGAPPGVAAVVAYAGLWHDGSEVMGLHDMPTPIKHNPLFDGYRVVEDRVQSVLYDWADVGDERDHPVIKEVDGVLFATEQRDLQHPIPDEFREGRARAEPLVERIIPWDKVRVQHYFVERCYSLRRKFGATGPMKGSENDLR